MGFHNNECCRSVAAGLLEWRQGHKRARGRPWRAGSEPGEGKVDNSLMNEIFVATNAVADSRTSSAVSWLVTITGTPRITSGWKICLSAATASLEEVPRMMRSGQLKSSTAQPGVKKTGCETMVARRLASRRRFSMMAALPTGTGVRMERIGGLGARRAIS